MPYVEGIRNAVTRRLYVKRISELTGVEENHFPRLQNEESKKAWNKNDALKGNIVEKKVINACMTNPHLLEQYKGKDVFLYIKNHHVREVLLRILRHVEEKRDFEAHSFIQTLEDGDLKSLVLDAVFQSAELVDDEPEKVFFDYFRHIEKQFFKEESKKITARLSEAERRGDEKEITELLKQKRQVLTYMKNNFL